MRVSQEKRVYGWRVCEYSVAFERHQNLRHLRNLRIDVLAFWGPLCLCSAYLSMDYLLNRRVRR
ncbi:MAG TPA: hypothetical protein HPP83_03810 [Candidatus Hydrogenedentes bacterium]|nr:hypothetical protein [Candidatus Hydrogenedentota bacterium]